MKKLSYINKIFFSVYIKNFQAKVGRKFWMQMETKNLDKIIDDGNQALI